MTRLIGTELFKLRKRGMTWTLLGVLVGIMIILHLILFAISRSNLGQGPGAGIVQTLLGLPVAIPFALSILTSFGVVLAVILLASSTGNEYNWRTIRIALISSESRLEFLGAKLVSAGILFIIGMVIALATSFVMSLITTAIAGNPFDFSFATGAYFWDNFVQFWRTFFVLLPFTSLALFFAIGGRSVMPGIAVGLGILFLEPIISSFMRLAGGWVSDIPNYLFSANVNAINALNGLPGVFGGAAGAISQAPSVTHAFSVLSIYTVVALVITFYIFRHRDVTG